MNEDRFLKDIIKSSVDKLEDQLVQYPHLKQLDAIDVERTLRAGLDSIIDELCKGNKVYLINSLNFFPKDYDDKVTKNPQTGEEMVIPKYRAINVKPSSSAKERLRQGRANYPIK